MQYKFIKITTRCNYRFYNHRIRKFIYEYCKDYSCCKTQHKYNKKV